MKKKKKEINVRELVNKHQANCERIQEIADLCEQEQRERTDVEETEYRSLKRENEIIQMKMQSLSAPSPVEAMTPTQQLRELVNAPNPINRATIMLVREEAGAESSSTSASSAPMMSSVADGTGIIPVSEQEMLKPLRSGLIYDKVGINVRSGLPAGELRWPLHTKATAFFVEEGERSPDTAIEFDKLTVSPRRISTAIPVTKELLDSTSGVVEQVIREEMPAAVVDLINEAMFATSKTLTSGDKTITRKVYGPFVEAANKPFDFAGDVPTRKELIKMKTSVTKTGIKLTHPCWVMTEDMKADLEDTKVDAGSGRFVCENDLILGYPVFTTPFIGAGNIGFGEWSYQAAGFFGPITLTVDPYTLLRQNSDDFVLNASFATVTLRKEAFVLGHKKATS